MDDNFKKLTVKGILKGCEPPIKPFRRDNILHFRTCQNDLLEKPANDIVNHPSFDVDKFLLWYYFLKN